MLAACTGPGDDPGSVALDDLQVTGARTQLNPAFDPSVLRYSVIANDPAEPISVTPFAARSLVIAVDGRLTSSGSATLLDELMPGESVTISVQETFGKRDQFTTYELVYLPADFPELDVTVLEDGASNDPLYVNLRRFSHSYIAILDNHGVPTFYRREEQIALDFKWHAETGERSYALFTGTRNQWGRNDTERVVLDDNFDEIDRITTVGLSHTDHHDFLIEPNDEIVLVAYDGALRDLTAFGLGPEEPVEESVVQVLDRNTRQVLFQWNSWDEVPYDDQLYDPPRLEYAHVNSVFVDTDGHLIVSARGTSQVMKIARPGGQILWKLGGKSNQFTFINDPYGQFCGQHFATRLSNGNLLLFDNGINCRTDLPARDQLTRIVEYRLDEQLLEAELVWSYTQEGNYSFAQGSAQRLPNGNTLIGWGAGPMTVATEVRPDGTKVFELVGSHDVGTLDTYRALRFPE